MLTRRICSRACGAIYSPPVPARRHQPLVRPRHGDVHAPSFGFQRQHAQALDDVRDEDRAVRVGQGGAGGQVAAEGRSRTAPRRGSGRAFYASHDGGQVVGGEGAVGARRDQARLDAPVGLRVPRVDDARVTRRSTLTTLSPGSRGAGRRPPGTARDRCSWSGPGARRGRPSAGRAARAPTRTSATTPSAPMKNSERVIAP